MKFTVVRYAGSAFLLAMTLAARDAAAVEHGFYLGVGASSVSAEYAPSRRIVGLAGVEGLPEGALDTADLKPLGSSSWRLIGGYRVLDWLALEASYNRFAGNSGLTGIFCVTAPCPASERGEADTFSVSAVALYPIKSFDLYLRGGMTQWRSELTLFNPDDSRIGRYTDNSTRAGYGGGVQLRISKLATRLEYERVDFGGGDGADLVTLGFACTF